MKGLYVLNAYISMLFNLCSRCKNYIKLRACGICVGRHCVIHGHVGVNIAPSAKVSIGDNFYMSSGGHRNPLCCNIEGFFYAGENACICIGNHVGMSSTVLRAAQSITIGNYVKIGANVKVMDTDAHALDFNVRRVREEDAKQKRCAPVVIEDDVLIGVNSIILKGVTIGARSIIGAGSVVTKSVPSDCVACGNPARVVKILNTD